MKIGLLERRHKRPMRYGYDCRMEPYDWFDWTFRVIVPALLIVGCAITALIITHSNLIANGLVK